MSLTDPGPGAADLLSILSLPLSKAAEQLMKLPPQQMERLRTNLWDILGTVGRKEEFLALQRVLASKSDLSLEALSPLPLALGKILVAVRTGIQAFLHPSVQMSQQHLAEIFLQRRCKNMACQSPLPAGNCTCSTCSRSGFCNLCMCVVCKKFDFETNTCRWIGCDFCLHWCHSDCAIHMGHIRSVSATKAPDQANGPRRATGDGAGGREDTAFCCPSCGHCSDLIGFVKDVFEMCSEQWEARGTRHELECVRAMFTASSSAKGQELLRYVAKLLVNLDQGMDSKAVLQDFKAFLTSDLISAPQAGAPVSSAPDASSPAGRAPTSTSAAYKDRGRGGKGEGTDFEGGLAAGVAPGSGIGPRVPAGDNRLPVEVEALRGRGSVGEKRDGGGQVEVIFLDEDGAASALAAVDKELEQKRKEMEVADEERRKVERSITELQNVADSREEDAKRLEAEAAEARKEVQVLTNIIQVKKRAAERDFDSKRVMVQVEETEAKRRKIVEALEKMRSRGGGNAGIGSPALAHR